MSFDLLKMSEQVTGWHSFKNPEWKPPRRRHKPARQIIGDEQKRIQAKELSERDLENEVTYSTLQAPPSLKPIKTYCDITGLPTSYKSPTSQVRFYNMEVYDVVKNLPPGVDQEYLGLRGANVVLR